MLKHWMSQLQAASEAQNAKYQAQREEKARAEAEAARVRLTPLEDRLARLLTTIPLKCSARGSHCQRYKLRCADDRVATVIQANLVRRCVSWGLSDGATGVALTGSERCGER